MDLFEPLDVTTDAVSVTVLPEYAPMSGPQEISREMMDPELIVALQDTYDLAVFEEAPSSMQVGINVSWFSGSHANDLVVFVNQLKGARPWEFSALPAENPFATPITSAADPS